MNETTELDLRELGKMLLKRGWIIVLCAVLVASITLAYTALFVPSMYTASVTIYVNNNSGANNNGITSSDLAVALRLVATYVNIIESDTVLEDVIQETGLMLTPKQVRRMLSASAVDETEMFRVQITSQNPQMSADIANAIANVAPGRIADIIEGSSAKVIDYASVPAGRSSPSYTVNGAVGAVGGALAAVIGIALWMVCDTRIKREEDLTKISMIPVLGRIPDLNAVLEKSGKKVGR